MLKFIHCSDIHLGGLLHTSSRPKEEIDNKFENAVFNCFRYIIEMSIKYEVDFIIISGDLFDGKGRSLKFDKFFSQQCSKISEIPIYIVCGNHDPMDEKSQIFKLPTNVHYFRAEEVQTYEYVKNGKISARILGMSYRKRVESRNISNLYKTCDNSVYNIGVLHTSLDNNNKYAPCTLLDLKNNSNINYWALGHIHNRKVISSDKKVIAFPGTPQGRDFGEPSIGGCFLVTVKDDFSTDLKFVRTSDIMWEKINIDISEVDTLKTIDDLEEFIIEQIRGLVSSYKLNTNLEIENYNELQGISMQILINGNNEIGGIFEGHEEEIEKLLKNNINERTYKESKFNEIKDTCNPFIWIDSVYLNINQNIFKEDFESLKKNNVIYKELEKVFNSCKNDESVKTDLIKIMGQFWNEGEDTENTDDFSMSLDKEIFETLINQAEKLVLSKIIAGGEDSEN